MEPLDQLVEKLRAALGAGLRSVILYGSAAAGEHHGEFSDFNVLCILTRVTPVELGESEPIFKWWREAGHPSPLLMSELEVRTSTDCFPIEFHDMRENRRVLFGDDLIAGLEVDNSFYRAQVEHELRAKLLRLRQKAAAVLSDEKALMRLMLDSVSTFCVLGRHALLLSGVVVGWGKRDTTAKLREIAVDPEPFNVLLDAREKNKSSRSPSAAVLFGQYLQQIETLVSHVDALAK